jgi:hypothetical protein
MGANSCLLGRGTTKRPQRTPVGWARIRPSRHPQRRRAHATVLVGGEDGEDVSVLRYAGGEPQVLRGGVGVVTERLLGCWARRRLAPADAKSRR